MIDKPKSFNEIYKRTQQACGSNNLEEIKRILSYDSYPELTQEEKEKHLFMSANISFYYSQLGMDILSYLVLEYGIKEDPSIGLYIKQEIEELFWKRKLNEDLEKELGDNNKSSKKLKV